MRDNVCIIFIVVDTLRKDFAQPLEKELTKLGFTSYENVISPAPWTMPSHASIFTGLYPAFHGAHETRDKKDTQVRLKRSDILSSQLHDQGYETYLLSANPYIRPTFGFKGFDYFYYSSGPYFPILTPNEKDKIRDIIEVYNIRSQFELAKILLLNKQFNLMVKGSISYFINKPYLYLYSLFKKWPKDKGANELIKVLKKILNTTINNTQKFIFINLMEVHEPYSLGENAHSIIEKNIKTGKVDNNLVKRWRIKYLNEVKYVTKKILEIINILKKKNIFDKSLIIVTSDHGQLLGEYGRIGHVTFLYDELLRIPLLIKYPKGSEIELSQNTSKYISLVNLKSFILDIINNRLENDSCLYSNVVFAESYGIPLKINISTKEERINIERLEKYRIAIYYKNFKGIFNVNDWKFEEILSYSSKYEIPEDIIYHMKKYIIRFLKTVTVAKIKKGVKL